jgi:hypothetical protein
MRLLALGRAIAILTMLSSGVNAADLALPPPAVGPPQYGVAPPPALPPPQIIIVPGLPAPPLYDGAVASRSACPPSWRCGDRECGWQPGCAPPPPERYPDQYGLPGAQVYSGRGAPPAPDLYPDQYGPPHPQVYSDRGAPPPPERYPDQYGLPGPQVYSGRGAPPAPDLYPDQYGPPHPQVYSGRGALPRYPGQYAPQVYRGLSGPYSAD